MCGLTYENWYALKKHKVQGHGGEFNCDLCAFKNKNEHALKKHKVWDHCG